MPSHKFGISRDKWLDSYFWFGAAGKYFLLFHTTQGLNALLGMILYLARYLQFIHAHVTS